jgi:hypothetical protein
MTAELTARFKIRSDNLTGLFLKALDFDYVQLVYKTRVSGRSLSGSLQEAQNLFRIFVRNNGLIFINNLPVLIDYKSPSFC